MVSPLPSCMSCGSSTIELPPSSCMATSKETRVRVEGFSKIMASTAPCLHLVPFGSAPCGLALHRGSLVEDRAQSLGGPNASISRKCLGFMDLFFGSA